MAVSVRCTLSPESNAVIRTNSSVRCVCAARGRRRWTSMPPVAGGGLSGHRLIGTGGCVVFLFRRHGQHALCRRGGVRVPATGDGEAGAHNAGHSRCPQHLRGRPTPRRISAQVFALVRRSRGIHQAGTPMVRSIGAVQAASVQTSSCCSRHRATRLAPARTCCESFRCSKRRLQEGLRDDANPTGDGKRPRPPRLPTACSPTPPRVQVRDVRPYRVPAAWDRRVRSAHRYRRIRPRRIPGRVARRRPGMLRPGPRTRRTLRTS